MMKKYLEQRNGITLVALVVTIIVLIILAGVSINLVLGNNGIITKAQEAKRAQEIAEITSQIQLEIASKEIENEGEITLSKIEEILAKYGTVNKNENKTIKSLAPTGKDYEIAFDQIYGGQIATLKTDGSYSQEKRVNTPKINESQGMKLVTFNLSTKTWIEDASKADYEYIAGEGTNDNTLSKWANAIVTKDGVDSYFVWIPRYAYKITYYTDANKTTVSEENLGYGSIDVKFIKGTGVEVTDGTICKFADDETLTANDYIIHPAFTSNANLGGGFGELAGLWIGKFETSRSDADNTSVGNSNIIKVAPNVKSWTNINIGEMYTYSKAYNTNLNSHMAKKANGEL